MLLFRRMWLVPAILLTCVIFFLYQRAQSSAIQVQQDQSKLKSPSRPHWQKHPDHYPVTSLISLPTGSPVAIPRIQFAFPEESPSRKAQLQERRALIRSSFQHSWAGYKKHAWLKDEVAPVTGQFKDTFGGWAATLVDSLDTLWLMGEKKEFENAVEALDLIDFTTSDTGTLNLFETTIRYLGGFLGAYDITDGAYPKLLEKAVQLGDMLLSSFDTPNRMPMTRWDWMSSANNLKIEASDSTLIAELGSLTLEFTRLSQITKEPKYFDAVQRVSNELARVQNSTKIPGLWPVVCNAKTLTFDYNHFTMGGMADSTYEYLPKEYLMLGGLSAQYKTMYESAVDAAKKHLFFQPMIPQNKSILFSGNARISTAGEVSLEPQGQHLACFTGGMLAAGAKIFNRPDDLETARRLVAGCMWAYHSMPTGLMPETFHLSPCEDPKACNWNKEKWYDAIIHAQSDDRETANMKPKERAEYWITKKKLFPGYTDIGDARYILRPEAIESIFILYRITGQPGLQDFAWLMFRHIREYTTTRIASSGIWDVRAERHTGEIVRQTDSMESFWLAETLKYFYLIFSPPDMLSLDDYVLNTEAHPLRRPS